jgi:conjugative transfer region lipoprotein (TIGR03751 family)
MTPLTFVRLTLIIWISAVYLTGCVAPGKGTLPQGGEMTMADIYKQETMPLLNQPFHEETDDGHGDRSLENVREQAAREEAATDYTGYTAVSVNQVHHLFKRLNNPEIPMYIYPHLVLEEEEEETPVPGYTTAFFLYKKNQFALPNKRY